MSVLPDFRHHRPASLDEALDLVSFDNAPYAGGTELLLAMRAGLLRPDALVDLKRVDELREIRVSDDGVEIGGAVTHQEAIDHAGVAESMPVLGSVLRKVGNPRVRAAGTLGGNLCFAEPKSDVATLLVALEAQVELRSKDERRIVSIDDFILGPYTTDREESEVLVSIHVPERGDRPAAYSKFQTMERPTLGVAAVITSHGRCRLVMGACGGRPEWFEADAPGAIDPEEVAGTIEVIPDSTGSERYKRHVAARYAARTLRALEDGS